MEHVDLYLTNWQPAQDEFVETWKAFIELQQEGLVRSIGVSNFQQPHLEQIAAETGVTPVVKQTELHPYFQQAGPRRERAHIGIATEPWGPLAQGGVLEDPAFVQIAEAPGKTAGRWFCARHPAQHRVPQVGHGPGWIFETVDMFDFSLSDDEISAIDALDAGERTGPGADTAVRP